MQENVIIGIESKEEYSRLFTYMWTWPTLKINAKVIHISTANISQMVDI